MSASLTTAKEQAIKNKAKKGKATKSSSKSLTPTSKASVACSIPTTDYSNRITNVNMLGDPIVYTCIKVLAESIASTPLEVYNNNTHQKATDFYLYRLLKRAPNELQTPFEVLQWLMIDYYRYGYALAATPRDPKTKQIIGIYPLPADQVAVSADDNGNTFYIYNDFAFENFDMLKIVNFFDRGLVGSSLLDYQRNTLGTSAATEAFAAESFSRGTFPAGIALVKADTTREELLELKTRFKEEFSGTSNAGAVLMSAALDDYKPFAISNDSAQMIDARKYNRSLIAGLFRVPAHLINDLEKATFSNVEHLDLSFVKHTLRPIAKNIEQRLNLTLLTDSESENYNIAFNFDAMLRGDMVSRTQALTSQVQTGLRTINEARALENLPPLPSGDTLRNNAALVPSLQQEQ